MPALSECGRIALEQSAIAHREAYISFYLIPYAGHSVDFGVWAKEAEEVKVTDHLGLETLHSFVVEIEVELDESVVLVLEAGECLVECGWVKVDGDAVAVVDRAHEVVHLACANGGWVGCGTAEYRGKVVERCGGGDVFCFAADEDVHVLRQGLETPCFDEVGFERRYELVGRHGRLDFFRVQLALTLSRHMLAQVEMGEAESPRSLDHL